MSKAMSIRQAAAVIFVLVALLPLLLFVAVLSASGLISRTETQLATVMAVVIACLGFVVFRRLVDQIARLAARVQGPAEAESPGVGEPQRVPALGHVSEIGQLTGAFQQMLGDLRSSTQRLEDLVFKLGTLNDLVEMSARTPAIEDLLPSFLHTTMRVVHAHGGAIMLFDPQAGGLRTAASRGLPTARDGGAENVFAEGIATKVAESGDAVVVDSMEKDARFACAGGGTPGAGSFLCMPLRAGDRVIGVINLVRKEDGAAAAAPHPFSPSDLQFLSTLLTYIAYAVDNARLLDEAQQAARQRQRVLDDLRATQAQLVRGETLSAIGKLASGMAHHLNNLFAVILGRLETLLVKLPDPEARRYIEIIQRAAQDGAEVVRRVQRFSRVQPVSRATPVDLNQLAQEVLELTRPRWHSEAQLRQIRIDTELDLGSIKLVAGEIAPLREVLMNLVLNAIDAMPGGGCLTIRTWSAGQEVHCAVADTGSGMTEEVRRRAFEPFFTTKGPKSTGLGLSVTYGIVQRHNGKIEIDTGAGRGTTVHITLPAALPTARAAGADGGAQGDMPLRVLVVDDEPEVRSAVADMLGTAGYTAFQASGGPEALAWLDAGQPVDLLLTDLGMPGMTGTDLARTVRDRWPHLRLGLMTGWDEAESPVGEASSVVDFVIAKPFKLGALLSAYAGAPGEGG
ncbi:MAG TPA: ATP-binding protein [Candidatus Bathyarchaeia archaeon]|nr:ATP-binding protein [Candidatus Bathyarchaeia archaeon]